MQMRSCTHMVLISIADLHDLCYYAPVRSYMGYLREKRREAGGEAGWIDCPAPAIPLPGQYLLAMDPEDRDAPLATPLFPAGSATTGFLAAGPFPLGWMPGSTLRLYGPLGHGFSLPGGARSVALAALGETVARLLPLVTIALDLGASVALCSDAPLSQLPTAVEAYPASALPELYAWADYLALDLPLHALPELRQRIGLDAHARLSIPTQALVQAPMPCAGAGAAACGVCAVPVKRDWKTALLACKDGPVFDLDEILL